MVQESLKQDTVVMEQSNEYIVECVEQLSDNALCAESEEEDVLVEAIAILIIVLLVLVALTLGVFLFTLFIKFCSMHWGMSVYEGTLLGAVLILLFLFLVVFIGTL